MTNQEQNTPEEKTPKEIILEQHEDNLKRHEVETIKSVESDVSSDEQEGTKDPRDKKITDLEVQLAEVQKNARDDLLRMQADMDNLRRRTKLDMEKAHKFALEKFINELLPVIDSLDRALELADKDKDHVNNTAMIEGIELTLKSMLDVIRKFGVEIISDTNVALNPNVHQAIAMIESDTITDGNVLTVVQKGYTLHGRTIRAAMVTVAKAVSKEKI